MLCMNLSECVFGCVPVMSPWAWCVWRWSFDSLSSCTGSDAPDAQVDRKHLRPTSGQHHGPNTQPSPPPAIPPPLALRLKNRQNRAVYFCGSGRSCVKSDIMPQVMSLKLVLAGAEDYKSGLSGVRKKWVYQTTVARYTSCYYRNTAKPSTELMAVEMLCG